MLLALAVVDVAFEELLQPATVFVVPSLVVDLPPAVCIPGFALSIVVPRQFVVLQPKVPEFIVDLQLYFLTPVA